MKTLTGKQAGNFEEAARVCFREAGAADMAVAIAHLFKPVVQRDTVESEAEKAVASTIKAGYGKNATWSGKRWYVPVPALGYDTRQIPSILFEVRTDLVAVERVRTRDDSQQVTLVGAVGKPHKLVLPVIFLRAILDDDLERFAILARGGNWTTWDIPGTKPVQFPDELIARLSNTLRRKSVGTWLQAFGPQGRSVAPLVVGALLGLQYIDKKEAASATEQSWTYDGLVTALEGMAYSAEEARDLIRRASPQLRADHTVEQAMRIVMENIKKGG